MRNTLVLALAVAASLSAQVSSERILNAADTPGDWLTYNGTYGSTHHSKLDRITAQNVGELELKWVYQAQSLEKFESTPLVVDGVLYTVEMPNNVVALDAVTGRRFWKYEHVIESFKNACCGSVNRGLAILDETLYMGTIDGKLLALDAKSGALRFSKQLVDPTGGYSLTTAPLVVKDKIVLGTAGGEYGIRGWIGAFDPEDGTELWRFNTIPGPGEPGHETWENDAWKTGGGSIWLTGSYDADLDLMYWGVGNPAPDWNADVRPGDNLYTDSVVALDPDDGKLKWHFQFTPHDRWDWDAVQIPVLVDRPWKGEMRKLMLWGNRNGFFYVLDRTDGVFLSGTPFAKVTWTDGLDENGRPNYLPEAFPSRAGVRVWPGVQGATNWYAPAYSPETDLFYLAAWEFATIYHMGDATYVRGNRYAGSLPRAAWPEVMRDDDPGYGTLRALDPDTGKTVWEFKMTAISDSGLLSTAGGVLFSGSLEGHFLAFDPKDGDLLWRKNLGGRCVNSPITYLAGEEQLVTIACGNSLYAFGLRE